MEKNEITTEISEGKACLGIEFGSTRIKAVLINSKNEPIASGAFDWENSLVDGIWTYSMDEILNGLKTCYHDMKKDVQEKYGVTLKKLGALGVSAMMHGYLAFDKSDNLLVPFRTWRNTITGEASEKLSALFGYPIPERWTIAHLYQAVLKKEAHVKDVAFVTTLDGFIHWRLSGKKITGVGDASGIFPIDIATRKFNKTMIEKFDALDEIKAMPWKLEEILPEVLVAGENAGYLTKEGAALLDCEGDLEAGCPMAASEGDAETGMMATNSVSARSGNVSAGTSVFAMVVLEKELSKAYNGLIDLVTTPDGKLVAMAHANNCTGEYDKWIKLFGEVAKTLGFDVKKGETVTLGSNGQTYQCVNFFAIATSSGTLPEPVIGDINADGEAGVADLVMLSAHLLGKTPLTYDECARADLAQDGIIDTFDLIALRKAVIQQ